MLPVCSATPNCSSHSQISFHGSLRSFYPFYKDFDSRSIVEHRLLLGLSNGPQSQRISFKTQAMKTVYSNFVESSGQSISTDFITSHSCSNELVDFCKLSSSLSSQIEAIDKGHAMGLGELKYIETSTTSAVEEGVSDFTDQWPNHAKDLIGPVELKAMPSSDIIPENLTSVSDSFDVNNVSLPSEESSFENILAGVSDSINSSVNKTESVVKISLDTLTSFVTSVTKSASEAVDIAVNGVFSTADQTRELAGNWLTSFSSNLKEATNRSTVIAVDLLRRTIVAVEDSITYGASFVVYSYGSAKDLLPPEIRDALNLSEDRAVKIFRPVGTAFQQVYITIEGLERSFGLDPNDPLVPFVLFLGTSATFWVVYWVFAYGGYSGDLSPQSTLELLAGKENAVLIDIRPEVLRERDGIPDLRREARFRYAGVTLPEVDGSVRKLLKGGRDLDDTLIAAVIRNLKTVQDRSNVIIMDADGNHSKGIARSLRKLGVQNRNSKDLVRVIVRPYLVQGGFQSWVKQGLRIKELKPETMLTILNEEAEAILEDINPSPVQVLGYGVGFVLSSYALLEWEKTLQLIGIVGLSLTLYRRVASYEDVKDFKQDVSLLLAPVTLGARAFSWAAGKLETNQIGLPTSPSSLDVQIRVLQASAKHESDMEGVQDPSSEPIAPATVSENADLSDA
ncbi:hypothetical protein CFOL_v3_30247 [Cephalotus follicularis]|uniref:Rhodanese domain-containing protein n=1 Tax=Cephalotus follicularis TaxID=3775 RepID=A0A1Q3D335_CEPFO|nr:hypothetical protein CFOL_v3_30247 [Cephalotus follicularis]